MAALLGLALAVAACGSSEAPGAAGSQASAGTTRLLAYARCMRSHGIADFPDPSGRGFAIGRHGSGGDLEPGSPAFVAAHRACRALLPGAQQPAQLSTQRLAREVRWARCLRAHGVPGFPDPNGQGAFDSARFDDASPIFQAASRACIAVQPTGAVTAVPGRS